ncbi:hypothetical protein F383_26528 [Gossypium arboreum]|uniref:Uncharacterized protein n=1 Tax=Gossypium arboreum TaxID=29729 RepID=A0A0B0PFM4_GOSAR|nr:hypothetical protein F383_26528 [Gossypium arboreum]
MYLKLYPNRASYQTSIKHGKEIE